jgi:thymidylate kinase
VRAGFRAIAAASPGRCVMVDASGEIAAVQAAIVAQLRKSFGSLGA